ncbi:MAG: O-antigen ligase family protein [bacterium]|nr:O-antigen ligase family protein [bacterium]
MLYFASKNSKFSVDKYLIMAINQSLKKSILMIFPNKKTNDSTMFGAEYFCVLLLKIGTLSILALPLVASGLLITGSQDKVFAFRIIIEIMALPWLWLLLFKPRWREPWKKLRGISLAIVSFIATFMFSVIVSTMFSADPSFSFFSDVQRMLGFLTLSHLFIFFAIIFTVFDNKFFINLFKFSVIIALAVSFSAIVENNFRILATMSRIQGTMQHPSFFASYLISNIFISLFLALKTNRNLEKIIYFLCFGILITTLLLTGTRGGMIGLLGGMFVFFTIFVYKKFSTKQKFFRSRLFIVTVSFIAIVSMLTLFAYQNKDSSLVKSTPLKFVSKITLSEGNRRFTLWRLSYDAFKEKPILGWGVDNFKMAYIRYYDPKLYEGEGLSGAHFDKAHNIVVDTAVTQGIVGLIAYLGIFAAVTFALLKIIKKETSGKKQALRSPPLAMASLVGLLFAYFIQNLFVFDTIVSYIFFFLILVFITKEVNFYDKKERSSFVANAFSDKKIDFKRYRFLSGPLKIIAIITAFYVITVSMWSFNFKPALASYYFNRAINAVNQQHFEEAVDLYKKSLSLSVLNGQEVDKAVLDTFDLLSRQKNDKLFWAFFDLEEKQLVKIGSLRTYPLIAWGQIYIMASDKKAEYHNIAIQNYEKLLQKSPKLLSGYYDLATFYANNNEYDKAYQVLDKVKNFDPPENPETSKHLFEIALKQGDREKSEKNFKIYLGKSLNQKNVDGKRNILTQCLLDESRKAISLERVAIYREIVLRNYEREIDRYIAESSDTDLLFQIVLFEMNLRELDKASEVAKKIAIIDPESKQDIDGVLKAIDSLRK